MGRAGRQFAEDAVQRMIGTHLVGTPGDDDQRRESMRAPTEVAEQIERRRVRPVDVLEHDHRGRRASSRGWRRTPRRPDGAEPRLRAAPRSPRRDRTPCRAAVRGAVACRAPRTRPTGTAPPEARASPTLRAASSCRRRLRRRRPRTVLAPAMPPALATSLRALRHARAGSSSCLPDLQIDPHASPTIAGCQVRLGLCSLQVRHSYRRPRVEVSGDSTSQIGGPSPMPSLWRLFRLLGSRTPASGVRISAPCAGRVLEVST